MSKRVGIFSGVFDPVHSGHIGFALEAAKQAKLNTVYFLVEAKPRRKTGVTHLGHRTAMIKLAITDYPQLKLLDLPDKQFSVAKTLPRLKQYFPNDTIVYLAGSDLLEHMPQWQLIDQMFRQMGLIVGLRRATSKKEVKNLLTNLPVQPTELHIINSPGLAISSQQVRRSIRNGVGAEELPADVQDYIKANWLYAAPSNSSSSS